MNAKINRVDYPIEKAVKDINKAGLPCYLGKRPLHGR